MKAPAAAFDGRKSTRLRECGHGRQPNPDAYVANMNLPGYQGAMAMLLKGFGKICAAERDENTERKDFTPTEAVAIGRLIEERHKAKIATQRVDMGRQNRLGKDLVKNQLLPAGDTRETVAAAVGLSGTGYYKAKRVVAAALLSGARKSRFDASIPVPHA